MVDHHLDARGLLCPLPVLRARKAMKPLPVGGVLHIETTDAASPADFAAFCAATGHRLLASEASDGVYHFTIEKVGATSPPEG
jgi:tRNA 2-thiouridine synthesizing protein A